MFDKYISKIMWLIRLYKIYTVSVDHKSDLL